MKVIKKIDDKFTEIVVYLIALVIALGGWVCGLGMACVRVEVNTGEYVKIHGLTCHCGDGGRQ